MTQISLSKALAIIDKHRGEVLSERANHEKGSPAYSECSDELRRLNRLKKEFALVSDTDQLPLGL
jgi:hypothetical protein